MHPEKIKQLLDHEPFLPLYLHLNNGEVVEITDPGSAWLDGTTLQIFTFIRREAQSAETNRFIPLRSIAQVVQMNVA